MSEPSAAHEYRVQLLETLSSLVGCHEDIGNELPNGSRPDVVRLDRKRRLLFFGDAKDTETPGNRDTQARLYRYIGDLVSHAQHAGTVSIFALCFREYAHIDQWTNVIRDLVNEAQGAITSTKIGSFGSGTCTAWFVVSTALCV